MASSMSPIGANDRLQVFDPDGNSVAIMTGDATISKWGKDKLDAKLGNVAGAGHCPRHRAGEELLGARWPWK